MEASRAPGWSHDNDIAPAVLAIGRPSFPQTLIETLRRIAGVGHCMVFTFDDDRSARCLLDIGNIPIGPDLGAAYSGHFHLADPNRDTIFRERASVSPFVLPAFARRMYSARYAKIFFEDADIVDKFATAIWVDRTCFYVNFYRTLDQGRFNSHQVERLKGIAPGLGAAVARHFQAQAPSDHNPFHKLEVLFSTSAPLTRLTCREREVCLRILSGFSSEAISADLGISLQSTFTYRKRAYKKLGIVSQNELFAIALRLLASPHRLN
ncbi:helix-turn-helix transcriptional regulator [Bradyrhizobium neotropicale]|uniref:Helix-turn-helix transcriptional regulator n=1 Tax=Bradyrhizobium neotropicale TaxID=1497615 RepID=A0A176YK64_9BRAD|nr:helix-turn-helix transcriptional regulator [Bradyrhizobium neotropicale]OAF07376.1 helix-turn-helix transcriptional regulator [Bradyrhizobium neotropicale]